VEASEVIGASWTAYVDSFRLEGHGSIRFGFKPEKAFKFDEPGSEKQALQWALTGPAKRENQGPSQRKKVDPKACNGTR